MKTLKNYLFLSLLVFIRPSVSFGMEEIPSQAHSNTLHFFDDELEFFKAACSSWNYDNIIKHINQHSTETIYSHLINSDALQTILLKDNGTVLLNLSKKIGPQLLIEAATKFGCDQQIIASLFQNKFALPQINSILTTSSTKKEIRDKILKFYVSSNFKKLSEFICESIQISKTQGDIERADSLLQIVIEALAYIMPHKVNYDDAQHDYINYVSSTNSKKPLKKPLKTLGLNLSIPENWKNIVNATTFSFIYHNQMGSIAQHAIELSSKPNAANAKILVDLIFNNLLAVALHNKENLCFLRGTNRHADGCHSHEWDMLNALSDPQSFQALFSQPPVLVKGLTSPQYKFIKMLQQVLNLNNLIQNTIDFYLASNSPEKAFLLYIPEFPDSYANILQQSNVKNLFTNQLRAEQKTHIIQQWFNNRHFDFSKKINLILYFFNSDENRQFVISNMPPNTSLDELFQEQLANANLFKQQTSSRKQFGRVKLKKDQLANQATINNPKSMILDFLQAFAPYGSKDGEVKEVKLKISSNFVKSNKVFTNDSLQTLADIGFFDNYEVFKNEIFRTLYLDLKICLKNKDTKLDNLGDFIHKVFIINNYENSFISQFSEYLKNIKIRNKNDGTFRDFAEFLEWLITTPKLFNSYELALTPVYDQQTLENYQALMNTLVTKAQIVEETQYQLADGEIYIEQALVPDEVGFYFPEELHPLQKEAKHKTRTLEEWLDLGEPREYFTHLLVDMEEWLDAVQSARRDRFVQEILDDDFDPTILLAFDEISDEAKQKLQTNNNFQSLENIQVFEKMHSKFFKKQRIEFFGIKPRYKCSDFLTKSNIYSIRHLFEGVFLRRLKNELKKLPIKDEWKKFMRSFIGKCGGKEYSYYGSYFGFNKFYGDNRFKTTKVAPPRTPMENLEEEENRLIKKKKLSEDN